jgi:polyisoprenoid-binding protein YceI
MKRRRMILGLLALAATAAGALEPDQVQIAYELKIGSHQISGVSHAIEWQTETLDSDRVQVRLSVPIASFDSGHPEIDAAVRRALDAEHHPFAVLEGVALRDRLEGTLELAGVARPIAVRLHVERLDGSVIGAASFAVDLADYGLALPGVDRKVSVDAIVRLVASRNAVLAGGVARP